MTSAIVHAIPVKSTVEARAAEWTAHYLAINNLDESGRFEGINRRTVEFLLLGNDPSPTFTKAGISFQFYHTHGNKISIWKLAEGKWSECQLVE